MPLLVARLLRIARGTLRSGTSQMRCSLFLMAIPASPWRAMRQCLEHLRVREVATILSSYIASARFMSLNCLARSPAATRALARKAVSTSLLLASACSRKAHPSLKRPSAHQNSFSVSPKLKAVSRCAPWYSLRSSDHSMSARRLSCSCTKRSNHSAAAVP